MVAPRAPNPSGWVAVMRSGWLWLVGGVLAVLAIGAGGAGVASRWLDDDTPAVRIGRVVDSSEGAATQATAVASPTSAPTPSPTPTPTPPPMPRSLLAEYQVIAYY